MGTKQYDSATDLITFSRNSTGTALRKISYGPELITNGGFDGSTGWNAFNGGAIANGQARIYSPDGSTIAGISQHNVIEIGKLYECTFDVTDVVLGTNLKENYSQTNIDVAASGEGSYTFAFTATSTSFGIKRSGGPTDIYVDNISVKEVIFDQAGGTLKLFNHPNDVPRIEYDENGTVKGLLIEEQRTNLLNYSDAQGSSWTNQAATITDLSDNALGVFDGASVASQGSTWNRLASSLTLVAGTTYAATVWFKKGTASNFRITFRSSPLAAETHVEGDFSSPPSNTITGAGTASAISQTDLGNDIKKVSFLFVPTSSGTHTLGFGPTTTTAGETAILYGAQVEVGSFPTSYIPTTGAAATRTADVATIPTSAFGYNQDEGTLVVEFEADSWAQNANTQSFSKVWEFTGNTGSNADGIFRDPATGDGDYLRYRFNESDATTAALGPANLNPVSGVNKVAVALGQGDAAIVMNGGTPATGSGTAAMDKYADILLGRSVNNNNFLNGHIRDFQYYPRRLTNAQLQELTT